MRRPTPKINLTIRWIIITLVVVQFVMISSPVAPTWAAPSRVLAESLSATSLKRVYLPYVTQPVEHQLLLGLYEPYDFGPSAAGEANIRNILGSADAWAGKKHSLVGLFEDPETPYNLEWGFTGNMETLWKSGYTPFVNIGSGRSAQYIASGQLDSKIYAMGKLYAAWIAQGGGRKAFLAPLQEMNGDWVPYGSDPANFKIAYDHFRTQFAKAGAPISSAWWVFAPNGYATTGNEFEKYYPGNDKVDVVAFSGYNYGFCAVGNPAWRRWLTPQETYDSHINRMRVMAPGKPVIVAQTGTTDQYSDPNIHDRAKKDQWLTDTYNYLSNKAGVLGILYFDFNLSSSGGCDLSVMNTTQKFSGYRSNGANPKVVYMSTSQIEASGFAPWK